jgi:hypothetical protein
MQSPAELGFQLQLGRLLEPRLQVCLMQNQQVPLQVVPRQAAVAEDDLSDLASVPGFLPPPSHDCHW